MKKLFALFLMSGFLLTFTACDSTKQGAEEDAEGIEENLDNTGEDIEEGIDDAGDELEDTGEDIEEEVEGDTM